MNVLLQQAVIIDSNSPYNGQKKDILIKNGKIAQIASHIEKGVGMQCITSPNLHVSNGWVDIFADYREPGYEHKETILTGLNSAANGGFTKVFLTPNTLPVVNSKSIIQFIIQSGAAHITEVKPLGVISANLEGKTIAEMIDMHSYGAIAFTDGWQPIQNTTLMLKALEYVKSFNGTLIQLPVDKNLAQGGLMHEGIESTRLGMPGIPSLSEYMMVYRDIELVRYTGSKIHFTGISSAESVDLIRKAKAEGLAVTCSVTPYHLTLNDSVLETYNSVYKVTPPLRTENDRQALVNGLIDGTIDIITSHHRPQEWDSKAKEFEYAGEGMNVQELTFPIVWNTLHSILPIETLVKCFSNNVNTIFFSNQPTIEEGAMANLTLFDTEIITNKNNLQSKSNNNPFVNQTLKGCILGVINGGDQHINAI
jgi:dihydroorotase